MISSSILLSYFLPFTILGVAGSKREFPCSMQNTMAPPYVNPPRSADTNLPPFNFYVLNSNGEPTKNYSQEVYTIKLNVSNKDDFFRQFLIQARPSSYDGSVATNVRVGEYIPDFSWNRQGLEILKCPSVLNNSITHSNEQKKQQIEFQWSIKRNEGPIQFLVTVVQEEFNYWVQWSPKAGLIFPNQEATFTGFVATLKSHRKLSQIESDNEIRFINSARVEKLGFAIDSSTKSSTEILFNLTRVTAEFETTISTATINEDREQSSTNQVGDFSTSKETFELTKIIQESTESFTSTDSTESSVSEENTFSEDTSPISENATISYGNGTLGENNNTKELLLISNDTNNFVSLNDENKIEKLSLNYSTTPKTRDNNDTKSESLFTNSSLFTDIPFFDTTKFETNMTDDSSRREKTDPKIAINTLENFELNASPTDLSETENTVCLKNFCKNRGTCSFDAYNKTICRCQEGFGGTQCELQDIDCATSPCLNNGTCLTVGHGYKCQCDAGYMGHKCQRPCQDMYMSCGFWKDEGKCEDMRKVTKFYDVNCAYTCGQCIFDNATIRTTNPLPPVLEPFRNILGTWATNFSQSQRFPIDFADAPFGYYEEIRFFVTTLPVFGTPSLNYTTMAVNLADPDDAKSYVGFLTLKPDTEPANVSIISTGNDGVSIIEEGILYGDMMNLTAQIFYVFPALATKSPKELQRTITFKGDVFEEEVERVDSNGLSNSFKKIYTKLNAYVAY